MELFQQEETREYFIRKNQELKEEIDNIKNEIIVNTDLEKLKEYYLEKYNCESIQLYMDKVDQKFSESKTEEYNIFYEMGLGESPTILVDSYKFDYLIPFSGSSQLLHLKPSMRILNTINIEGFENLNSEEYLPCIKFSLNIKRTELDKQDDPQKYIASRFENEFGSCKKMIAYVNNDVNAYNSQLEKNINKLLNDRKNKASSFYCLAEKLNIPLKINDQMLNGNRIPLTLKKEVRKFPDQQKKEESWCLSDEDYSYIKKVISQQCISFEHFPGACQKLEEEDLRDMLLGTLNTHFDSMASGETFSKNGKTDIRIQFKNKSAYIAECKIWYGISEFKKAITQLFSYTTWRDIKTSLIIFNKENKDFTAIINKIKKELEEHELKEKMLEISKNEWQCTFKKAQDSQELIHLHVIVCDINV